MHASARVEHNVRQSAALWGSCTLSTSANTSDCYEKRKRRVQRARRVRWLKPLERITMLTKAGYSEEHIYRMMMESADIAMSRRLCISMQRQVVA
ncbi:hypothetical protein Plhal304r1_c078g0164681 [Plasmopara halstedii]